MRWFLLGWIVSRFFVLDQDPVARHAPARSPDHQLVKTMDGGSGTPPTGK